MKKQLLAFAFLSFGLTSFGQSPRLSLYEEFTGETCPPCAATNPGLCTLLAQSVNTANCVPIKWQVPIPSAPTKTWSLYQTDKVEIDWRYSSYGYGINSAPSGRMDGQNVTVFGAASDHPADLTSTIIATAQSYTSAFNITMNRAWSPGCTAVNLTITVQATANFSAVGSLIFRTVMVEKAIHFTTQPGTNGEKDFYDIAIKSFPSIQGGVGLPGVWTTGQSQTFTLSCPVPSYTRNKNQIAFVGFIQDDGNRKVAQAARTSTAAIPSEALAAVGASVNLTCSGVINPTVSFRNDGASALSSLTLTPYTDGTARPTTVWTGNLAVGASTTMVLSNVPTSSSNGSHLFSFDMTMSVPLFNLTANDNSRNYYMAANYNGTMVSEGFPAVAYPPSGWAVTNADNGPSWSRSNITGGYNQSFESTKYDFYSNTVIGDKDELYLPPADLSGTTTPALSFDYAYTQRTAASNDKLEVMVSDNCGSSWSNVFSLAGSALATYDPISNVPYVPDPSDATHWKTANVPLTNFNKSTVIVKFVTTNDNGNNLYIDNVNLSKVSTVGLSKANALGTGFSVYPNPANGFAMVTLPSNINGIAKISLMNSLGQVVYEKSADAAGTQKIDLKEFASGLYFVIIENGSNKEVKKLNINR